MESAATFLKNVDADLYKEALVTTLDSGRKASPLEYFAIKASEAGFAPDSAELEQREQHYLRKFHVGEHETERARKVKDYAWQTWSLEKSFHECGMAIDGPDAVSVDKAFQLNTTRAIFPEFYDAQIVSGILAMPLLDTIVSRTVQIQNGIAIHVSMSDSAADRTSGESGEFAQAAEVNVVATSTPVTLKKWAYVLKVSDEAIRRARLPVMAMALNRVGKQLAIDQTDFALDVLMLGDGTSGAVGAVAATVSGAPVYSDWLKLMYAFTIGYMPTDVIMPTAVIQNMVALPQFADPWAFNRPFQASGNVPTLFGLQPHRWDSLGSSGWSTTKAVALDRNLSVVAYVEGGLQTESERVINGQFTQTVSSIYSAYAVWDRAAAKAITGMA